MIKPKPAVLFIITAAIATAVFFFINASSQEPALQENNQSLPEFSLTTFDDKQITLKEFRGRPVFIDFWAAWCPFCLDEMPKIEKIYQEFGEPAGGELVVLGVHRTDTENIQKAKVFAEKTGVSYPLIKDQSAQLYGFFLPGKNLMPYAVFIDRQGKVFKTKAGPKTEEEIRNIILSILNQNPNE